MLKRRLCKILVLLCLKITGSDRKNIFCTAYSQDKEDDFQSFAD